MQENFSQGHGSEEEAKFYLETNKYDVSRAIENIKNDLNFESSIY